jgi:hypothetical protein
MLQSSGWRLRRFGAESSLGSGSSPCLHRILCCKHLFSVGMRGTHLDMHQKYRSQSGSRGNRMDGIVSIWVWSVLCVKLHRIKKVASIRAIYTL